MTAINSITTALRHLFTMRFVPQSASGFSTQCASRVASRSAALGVAAAALVVGHVFAFSRSDDQPAPAAPAAKTHVLLTTSKGEILIRLDAEKAPVTVANFLAYVADKAYDGTIFHRVIGDFMIQGGGFNPDLSQRPVRQPIQSEAANGLKNGRGTIAMARTSNPNSATSQFYINVVDNTALDHNPDTRNPGYTVFGEVVVGLEVVDRIRSVETIARGIHEAVPTEPVIIERAIALDDDAVAARRKPKPSTTDSDDGAGTVKGNESDAPQRAK